MTVALDAMGGDYSPQNPVKSAAEMSREGIDIVLVGDESVIKNELDNLNFNAKKIEIVHAPEVVEMGENPLMALKNKKKSSIRVAYDLHKSGDVHSVVSAGNSGAMLAIGKFVLKTVKGVDRPCISALLPSLKDKVLLLDAGANMDCKPSHLLQFALLGDVYTEHIFGKKNPRVGLLNIGSEEGKGDELTKEAYNLLKDSPLNFIGNVEGKEFFNGDVDIVVTDGFAGNVLLKSVQGAANFLKQLLREEISNSLLSKIGTLFMLQSYKAVKKRTDYAEYGGAPLLGLKGNGIVCHGSSNPAALNFGVKFAQWASETEVVKKMEEKLQNYDSLM